MSAYFVFQQIVYVCVFSLPTYSISNLRILASSLSEAPMPQSLYPYCLVLVGSRKGFERDFTIKLK